MGAQRNPALEAQIDRLWRDPRTNAQARAMHQLYIQSLQEADRNAREHREAVQMKQWEHGLQTQAQREQQYRQFGHDTQRDEARFGHERGQQGQRLEHESKLQTERLDREDARPTPDMKQYNLYRQQEMDAGRTPMDYTPWAERMKRAGAQNITLDQRAETAEAQKIGAGSGERANRTVEAASAAQKTLYRINDIEARLKNFQTGKTTPGKVTVGAWAKAIGINEDVLRAVGLDPNAVGDAQAFEGLTNRMVVDMIGSGGFPANNFSDADRGFLVSVVPQLANDPRANKILMEVARRGAQRDIEKAKAWNQFRKDPANKGMSFDDFDISWSEKVAQQDILGDLAKEAEALASQPMPAASQDGPARPQTQADFDRLPSGSVYIDPDDGKTYRKR
jgi:hypothetical protein